MARESSLWQRCRTGIKNLRACGHSTHFCRLENSAGEGNPDIEGCINGSQTWIELKSCDRPARASTPIRPKCRESQSIWHRERTEAGGTVHWVLIQVGEAQKAKLYLIPGIRYDDITATEAALEGMSMCHPDAQMPEVLMRSCEGW